MFIVQLNDAIQGISKAGIPHKATQKLKYISSIRPQVANGTVHVFFHKSKKMGLRFPTEAEAQQALEFTRANYPTCKEMTVIGVKA